MQGPTGKSHTHPVRCATLLQAHGRVPGRTGVWVGDRKLGAVGVRITHGISSHGLAFNINTDLAYFKHIVPCGNADKQMTSVSQELRTGQAVDFDLVVDHFMGAFKQHFKFEQLQHVELEHILPADHQEQQAA